MRGEHPSEIIVYFRKAGSSPHARGARGRSGAVGHPPGLIPACAGSTPRTTWPSAAGTAHPRMCGEHPGPVVGSRADTGSSPQARGARDRRHLDAVDLGLIPAGAGSTFRVSGSGPPRSAHPRRRGEHLTALSAEVLGTGSSPQARGAPDSSAALVSLERLIPAGAGSTCMGLPARTAGPAHPRRRGEHTSSWEAVDIWPGSSPQARGARDRAVHDQRPVRLIPAGAGSTRTTAARNDA